MTSSALLSCLGFPGWGPLHLILPSQGHPRGVAGRLKMALRDGDRSAVGNLLPALLRRQTDIEPLLLLPCRPVGPRHPDDGPWAARDHPAYRYLLVCRYGAAVPVRIKAFCWQAQRSTWSGLCTTLPLADFVQRFGG
jgi:hypothetical protein